MHPNPFPFAARFFARGARGSPTRSKPGRRRRGEKKKMSFRRKYHSVPLGRDQFYIDVRYTNLRPIGGGSYGVVCSADDTATGRRVAIKKIANVFSDLVDAKRARRVLPPGKGGEGPVALARVCAYRAPTLGVSCGRSSCCGISGATRTSCR